MKKQKIFLIALTFLTLQCYGQGNSINMEKGLRKITDNKVPGRTLYQYGHADAFLNGIYAGSLSVKALKGYGDFGLGAPDQVNGELTMNNGKIYQTTFDGKTFGVPEYLSTPFAFTTFFRPKMSLRIACNGNLADLYQQLKKYLTNQNGMYAIRVRGHFKQVTTRAFPPVDKNDRTPLSQMLSRQRLLDFQNGGGTLVGFYLPAYMAGINIAGFHFHFLSDDLKHGGHLLGLRAGATLEVELSELDRFILELPKDQSFRSYIFSGHNRADIEKVEKGSK